METTTDRMVHRELVKALADAIGWAEAAYRETDDSKYLDAQEQAYVALRRLAR